MTTQRSGFRIQNVARTRSTVTHSSRGRADVRAAYFHFLREKAGVRADVARWLSPARPSMSFGAHSWLFLVTIVLVGCSPAVSALPAMPTAAIETTVDAPPKLRPRAKNIARPIEAIERVLIISIDGLRPDLALRAYMPRLRTLCAHGSYTFWAETAAEAYTLPCHVSMLTGVPSEKHGVTWNDYIEDVWPNSPTLFELAHEAGFTTALVSGKMKFITLLKPAGRTASTDYGQQTTSNLLFQRPSFWASNTLDYFYLPDTEPVSDHDIASEAVRILREHRPDVFFVHLPGVDTAGHGYGWGTPEQIVAIEQADSAVGELLDALAELSLNEQTVLILTADHGGAGLDHTAGDPRAHFIPWIISGPGIRRDYDLTLAATSIHIEDTFATACRFLGIQAPDECQGEAVLDVLEDASVTSAKDSPTE